MVLYIDNLSNNNKYRFIFVFRPPLGYDAKQMSDLISLLNFSCDLKFIGSVCGDFNFPNNDWTSDTDVSSMFLRTVDFAHFIVHSSLSQL